MSQTDQDEHRWVERARSGDPEAVGWLYERYFERIYRYVFVKVGDQTEAEDLAETVFLKMIESITAFQWQGSSFASWLYRIAHNSVIDSHRRIARRPQTSLEPVGDTLPAQTGDPHGLAEHSDLSAHLTSALSELTELQAQVIVLKFVAGLTNQEVASILDRTEGAVKALQHSALRNLQRLLARRGYP